MSTCGKIHNDRPFVEAAHVVYDHIMSVVGDQLGYVVPLDLHEVIKGTKYTNPINLDAACGFPYYGKTKSHVVRGPPEKPVFSRAYCRHFIKVLKRIDQERFAYNICTATLKDEIIKGVKIEDGLERVFFSGNVDFLILCRMYLAKLMDLFCINRDKLFGQIGMNAIGSEFSERLFSMYERINGKVGSIAQFLVDKGWIDSDYDKYDKRMLVLVYGCYVIHKIFSECPFYKDPQNAHHLIRVEAILRGFAKYIMVIGNDIFIMENKMPSGVFGTAWINCICEAILEVLLFYFCVYRKFNPSKPIIPSFVSDLIHIKFFDVVSLINYGDDNLKYVMDLWRDIYTVESIDEFSDIFRIRITSANKGEKIRFKHIQEVQFLKRTPVWDSARKILVGQLDFNSIVKMLLFSDSKEENRDAMVLNQALRELSYHDQHEYEKFKNIFQLDGDYEEMRDTALHMDQWSMNTLCIDISEMQDAEQTAYHAAMSGPDKMTSGFLNKMDVI